VYNRDDCVASNMMGIMDDFKHDVKDVVQVYKESYCRYNCWYGCCPWGTEHRYRKYNNAGDCENKAGGGGGYGQCAYNFLTTHMECKYSRSREKDIYRERDRERATVCVRTCCVCAY
jgi:hypothetical protein